LATDEGQDYRIEIEDADEYWAELERLPSATQEEVTSFVANYLTKQPTTIIPQLAGKLKELKGDYKGYWQYDVGEKRLIYLPEENPRRVLIKYLGPHPDWSKRGKKPWQ
jgi:mRNA-degrading endonuclease RelE of RelBE toxin-antitoxin system